MMSSQDGKKYSHQAPRQEQKDSHGPTVPYRLAEFVLYAIFVAGDVYELWEPHRISALIVTVAALGCLLVIDKGFSTKTIARTLIGASVLAFGAYFLVPEPMLPDVEVLGMLQPGNSPDPPNTCGSATNPDSWKILVGNAAIQFEQSAFITVLKIGQCPVLQVGRTAQGLSINAKLFDAKGRLIATVENNKFDALSGGASRVERNGNLSDLIVQGASGKELLNVRYVNRSTVVARGIFGCPGHSLVPIKDNEPIPGFMIPNGICIHVRKGTSFQTFFAVQ